jgi:ABC-type multidrug transport system ATPase subunit/ABC-type multidrug transport system permease subunit
MWYNDEKARDHLPPKNLRGSINFCYEGDIHIPELTVKQTFDFASEMTTEADIDTGPVQNQSRNAVWKEFRSQFVEVKAELYASLLNIDNVLNTVVGDELLRGVSGGQKKRVTIGEVMVQSKEAFFLDGYTKGLDAATALEIAEEIRGFCHGLKMVGVCSQYQASPEVLRTFDKVIVLQKGTSNRPNRCAYFGPTDDDSLEQYFNSIGSPKPPTHSWPDFLGTLGMFDSQRTAAPLPGLPTCPKNADEYADRFNKSELGLGLAAKIKQRDHVHTDPTLCQSLGAQIIHSRTQVQTMPKQFATALEREAALLQARFNTAIRDRVGQGVFLSIVVGTLWLQLDETADYIFQRATLVQFVVQNSATAAFLSIPQLLGDRAVMYKQTANHMYSPSVVFLAKAIIDFPILMFEALLSCTVIMFCSGLQHEGDRFWYFWLMMTFTTFAVSVITRAVAVTARTTFLAYLYGFFVLLTLNLLNGFVLPVDEIGWWYRWAAYISPFYWGFNGIMLNEFDDIQFDYTTNTSVPCELIPYLQEGHVPAAMWRVIQDQYLPAYKWPSYPQPAINVCTLGVTGRQALDDQFKISHDFDFKWAALAFNVAIAGVCMVIGCLIVTYVNVQGGAQQMAFVEKHDHKNARKKQSDMETAADSTAVAVPPTKGNWGALVAARQPASGQQTSKGKSDATPPAYFTFKDISYVVDVPKSEKNPDGKLQLLTKVNGHASPGMMIALMGTSGAGKTTLLDVLANRKTSGTITGDIMVNGFKQDKFFSRLCGYVEQTDNHVVRSTVREAFTFSATLRRGRGESSAQISRAVNKVIKQMKLESVADAIIGSEEFGTGISAEALKRVTIGVELVAGASIIFMDEPTSGLDTSGALQVADVCKDLADEGNCIICTIHQPSRVVFEQFSHLLLMQRGGRTVYWGEIGEHSHHLLSYFTAGGAEPCPKDLNPADYMLGAVAPASGEQATTDWTADVWDKSDGKRRLVAELADNAKALIPSGAPNLTEGFTSIIAASSIKQFVTLAGRQWLANWRDPTTMVGLLISSIYPAVFIATEFLEADVSGDTQASGRYTKLALFISIILSPLFFVFLALPACYEDRACFYRETSSGVYSKWLYAVVTQFCIIPYLIISALVFTVIVYHVLEFHSGRFFYFFLVFYIYMAASWFSGAACGAFTPNMAAGTQTAPFPINLSIIFCGFLVATDDIGWWWRWLYYYNPLGLTYVMQGAFKNEFEGRQFTSTDADTPPIYLTGDEQLSQFGWDGGLDKWECLVIAAVFAASWMAVGQFALVFIRHGSR